MAFIISNNEPVKGSTEEPSKISKGLQKYRRWRRWIGKDRTPYDFLKDSCPLFVALAITVPTSCSITKYQEDQKVAESLRAHEVKKQDILTQYFEQIARQTIPILTSEGKSKSTKQHPSIQEYQIISSARARTLSTLHQLDGGRKGEIIKFLYAASLINEKKKDKTVIDLRNADLADAKLSGANLGGANLRQVNLSGTNTDLSNADLTYTKLTKANLSGANLSGVNLTEANLEEADLTNANLIGAKFGEDATQKSEKQKGTNLTGAILKKTNLTGVDLTGIKLDPSTLKDAYLCRTTMPSGDNYPNPDRDCKKPVPALKKEKEKI
jgi:hypothetical protein